MAGRVINNSPVGATDWTSEVETKNIVKKGMFNMAFTNFLTTGEPEIIAGSSVDVNGIIIVFDSTETITGTAPTTTGYIVVSQTGVASYTDEEPIFDDLKKGYYDTLGNRAVMSYEGATFDRKFNLIDLNNAMLGNVKCGTMTVTKSVLLRIDNATFDQLYSGLVGVIPLNGTVMLSGSYYRGGNMYIVSNASRVSESSILIYSIRDDGSFSTQGVSPGSGVVVGDFDIITGVLIS